MLFVMLDFQKQRILEKSLLLVMLHGTLIKQKNSFYFILHSILQFDDDGIDKLSMMMGSGFTYKVSPISPILAALALHLQDQ